MHKHSKGNAYEYTKERCNMAKFDMYAAVTERIIAMLEDGVIPWEKPWTGGNGAWSRSTGKNYSLVNQFMLEEGEYVTYSQMVKEGGKLKPNEDGENPKAKQVWEFYYKRFDKEVENGETGEVETKAVFVPKCKYTNVFNVEKDTTLTLKYDRRAEPNGVEPLDALENIREDYVTRSGVTFEEHLSNEAYYSPIRDKVCVPLKEQFERVAEYYSTVFHELAHSTGHRTRLNRFDGSIAFFGSEDYSREELVAELTACSVLANMGVETSSSFRNNAAYIQSWVQALKEDTQAIIRASAKAEAAFYLIMGMENPRSAEPSDDAIAEA